jgi:hypothetical protein
LISDMVGLEPCGDELKEAVGDPCESVGRTLCEGLDILCGADPYCGEWFNVLGEPRKSVDGKLCDMPSCLYGVDSYEALSGFLGGEPYNWLGFF